MKWKKTMRKIVIANKKAECYIPEWYCPKCGTKYGPEFAKMVNYCYNCGTQLEEEDEDGN